MRKNGFYLGLVPLAELDDGTSCECGEHGDGQLSGLLPSIVVLDASEAVTQACNQLSWGLTIGRWVRRRIL